MSNLDRARTQMKKLGLKGFNIPKKTPNHPTKTHVVMAKEGSRTKLIRFNINDKIKSESSKTSSGYWVNKTKKLK